MNLKLAAGIVVLIMLHTPAVRSQNTASTAQSPQAPGAAAANPAAPPTDQQAQKLPEYPLPANGAPDAMPRQYIEMWNTGNLKLMDGMFASHPVLHTERLAGLALFPGIVENRIKAWRTCMPDFNYQILDTIVQGDGNKVVMRLVYSGTAVKPCYQDIPAPPPGPPPMKIHVNEFLIFKLDNGKIKEIWEQDDELRARLQMGATWCDNAQPTSAPPSPQSPPPASPNPAPPSPPSAKP